MLSQVLFVVNLPESNSIKLNPSKFTLDFVAIEQIHIQTSHSCWLLVKVTANNKNICFHDAFFLLCHIGIPLKCSIATI